MRATCENHANANVSTRLRMRNEYQSLQSLCSAKRQMKGAEAGAPLRRTTTMTTMTTTLQQVLRDRSGRRRFMRQFHCFYLSFSPLILIPCHRRCTHC